MKKRNYLKQANKLIVRFIWKLLTIAAVTGWIFLLISAFSDRVSPEQNSYIPFFGLFFPVIFLYNLLFLFLWLLFRKWKQSLITFSVFLICGGAISTYFPIHRKTKNIPDDCIKLITYNVMCFGYIDLAPAENHPILKYVIDQNPDIVCFQEYELYRELTEVQKALKTMPYASRQGDLVVFSKFPILSTKSIDLDNWQINSCMMELDINGRKVTLITNHLESNGITIDERMGYYEFTNDPNREKFEHFTHLLFTRLTPAFKKRAIQAQTIAKAIRENPNPYIIVCGDFNDTPISYARRTIKGDLKDAFVESGFGMGISFNRYNFLFRIDYILHSKNMKAYNCTVGKLKTSDHYPVSTYLQFLD